MTSIIPSPATTRHPKPGEDPDNYCTAGDNDDYTLVVTMGAATVPVDLGGNADKTAAFDASEKAAGFGEVTLTKGTSFSGPAGSVRGRIWGLDMACPIRLGADRPLWDDQVPGTRVYGFSGLLAATAALFGTQFTGPRFPILPGEFVTAAVKKKIVKGPAVVWASLAVGIPAREQADGGRLHAKLLMKAAGVKRGWQPPEKALPGPGPDPRNVSAARSVINIGKIRGITYGTVFIGMTQITVPEGHVGCAGVYGLYLRLAENAVPDSDLRTLPGMPLEEWRQTTARAGVTPLR